MMTRQYITIQQARTTMAQLRQVDTYKPITLIKKVIGFSMVGVGCATAWLPSGSVLLIMGGCALLGMDYKRVLNTMGFYGVRAYGWLYARRTKKLRSYHRHLRRVK